MLSKGMIGTSTWGIRKCEDSGKKTYELLYINKIVKFNNCGEHSGLECMPF